MEEHVTRKVEGRLGGGPQDLQEVRLLNRILRWAKEGLRAKQVSFPGFQREPASSVDAELLGAAEASQYRALGARANYFSLDRPDLGFAAKECCRRMSAPTSHDWAALLRLARYLLRRPRA
eukprot:7485076-Alexandrium_andersonii.AAC.1